MTLKVSTIGNSSGSDRIQINSSTGEVSPASGCNFRYTTLNLGGTNPIQSLTLLKSLNYIHYYETTGSILYLRTQMLQDALYELTYTSSGGAENTDFVLQPNGVDYASEFASSYRLTRQTDGVFIAQNQTLPNFYFDHQAGGDGNNSMGKLIMYSGTSVGRESQNMRCMYFGCDDGTNVAWGYSRWTTTRYWEWVGTLNFSGDNKRCWIRRIG
jgi:hypothetical protein